MMERRSDYGIGRKRRPSLAEMRTRDITESLQRELIRLGFDREDAAHPNLQLEPELVKHLRTYCWETWLVHPAVVGPAPLADIVAAVVRAERRHMGSAG